MSCFSESAQSLVWQVAGRMETQLGASGRVRSMLLIVFLLLQLSNCKAVRRLHGQGLHGDVDVSHGRWNSKASMKEGRTGREVCGCSCRGGI